MINEISFAVTKRWAESYIESRTPEQLQAFEALTLAKAVVAMPWPPRAPAPMSAPNPRGHPLHQWFLKEYAGFEDTIDHSPGQKEGNARSRRLIGDLIKQAEREGLFAPPEPNSKEAALERVKVLEQILGSEHLLDCQYKTDPIGVPGCICKVMHRAEIEPSKEALRRVWRAGRVFGGQQIFPTDLPPDIIDDRVFNAINEAN